MEALEECAAPRPLDFLTALRRTDWSKNKLLPWLLSHSNSSHDSFEQNEQMYESFLVIQTTVSVFNFFLKPQQ